MSTTRRGDHGRGHIFRRGATWWVQYFHHGERFRESSRSYRKKDATALLKARFGEMNAGKFVGPKGEKLTFGEMSGDLQADYRNQGNKSWDRVQRAVTKHLEPVFGRLMAHGMTAARIARYASDRLDEGAARATVACELAALKRMLHVAVELKKLTTVPAFPKGYTKKYLKNAREEFLEDWEYQLLLPELPVPAQPMIAFTFRTGWRWNSEVRTLKWDQVDEDHEVVILPGTMTKNGKPRKLPYGKVPEIQEAIAAAKAYTHEVEQRTGKQVPWVFHREGKQWDNSHTGFYKTWRQACKRAGAVGRDGKPKILHDLRRSAVRRYERMGVSREVAKALVGHETDSMYQRYNIVAEDELADAFAKSMGVKPQLSHNMATHENAHPVNG